MHYGMFRGIMGCSRGVPGLFRAVPGCSGGVPGMFRVFQGCSGVFRGVPWCSGVFRGCFRFCRHPAGKAGGRQQNPEHPEHPGTFRNIPVCSSSIRDNK